MRAYFKNIFEGLLAKEGNIHRLSFSFCFGTFIALTPTIPLQTWIILGVGWLGGLNIAVAMAALYIVNNPLTMIPIYVIGYGIGVWLFGVLGIDPVAYNPSWVDSFSSFMSRYIDLEKYLGGQLCLWCLLVGGCVFALLMTMPLYPVLTRMLTRLAHAKKK